MWQGAEARVEVVTVPNPSDNDTGHATGKVIKKTRFSKSYRHPDLDKRLTRQRTINEARALYRAGKCGLPVPSVLWVSPESGVIVMTFVGGSVTVKEALWGEGADEEWLAGQIGTICARLHHNDIIHGDLTTSNFLLVNRDCTNHDDKHVHVIDFGLAAMSTSVEDKAVDLYVLERAIQSTHSYKHPLFFSRCMAAYERVLRECDERMFVDIYKRFEQVRARGRKRT